MGRKEFGEQRPYFRLRWSWPLIQISNRIDIVIIWSFFCFFVYENKTRNSKFQVLSNLKGWWLYQYTSWENFKIGFILVHNAAIKALHDMKKSLMIIVQFFVSLHISILFVFAYFIFEAHKADKWHRVIPIHDVVLFKLRFYGNFDYLFV